jgi:hypothetical protein
MNDLLNNMLFYGTIFLVSLMVGAGLVGGLMLFFRADDDWAMFFGILIVVIALIVGLAFALFVDEIIGLSHL